MSQIVSTADSTPSLSHYPGWCPQFSLRALFGLMTFASLWLSLMRMKPHWGVLILALALATITTRLYTHLRLRMCGHSLSFDDSLALSSLGTMAVISCAMFYVTSIGPAVFLAQHMHGIPLFGRALGTVYLPITFLHDHTPLHNALETYVRCWCGV